MTETEFLARADAILDHLESQSDDWLAMYDFDVDASRNGNVLTLIFNNSIHVVINSQAPLQEMWVAARTGGFHYRFDGERWVDTRGGPDMAEALSQICTDANGGQPLKVTI